MMKKVTVLIFLLAAAIFIFKNFSFFEEKPKILIVNESSEFPEVKIPLQGFIPANISVDLILVDRAQVSLKAGCYLIEATTDACVAQAIQKGIEKKVDFRPTVYDVIFDIFKNLGIKVLAVKIVDMRENTFIGQLIIQQKDKVLALDIRPSDATAIALRANAPIYINETLAKNVGKYIC